MLSLLLLESVALDFAKSWVSLFPIDLGKVLGHCLYCRILNRIEAVDIKQAFCRCDHF